MQYLEHHGIKGMRWGVRRTPEQLGYRGVSNMSDEELKKINARYALESNYRKNHKSPTDRFKDTSNQAKNTADASANTLRKASDLIRDKRNNEDLSKYSNKELQDRITRINLESTYRNLTSSPSKLKSGMRTTATVLEVVGGATATAVAAVSLYDRFKSKG